MKFAVTGASGNFGSYLVNYLSQQGHSVVELGRTHRNKNVAWHPFKLGDVVDFKALGTVDVLVHAAYEFSSFTAEDVERKNVVPSISLIKQAHQNGVKKIIFISTVSAFDGCESVYGAGKVQVEKVVLELKGVNVRSALMFSDKPEGIVGKLAGIAKKIPLLPLVGASKNLYVTHLESLSEAIVYIANQGPEFSRTVTLAYPKPYKFKELIAELAKRAGKKVIIFPIPWRLLWIFLVTVEKLKINVGFRSDSLVGLMEGGKLSITGTDVVPVSFKSFGDK